MGEQKQKYKVAIIENHELGIYTIRHDLVKAIADAGFEVSVLTEVDDSFKHGDLEKQVRFVNVGRSVLNPVTAVRYCRALYTTLKDVKPDVCLTFTIRPAIYGNIVARSLGIKTISTITGTGPLFDSGSVSYRIARWLYTWVLKKASYVFFPNNDDLQEFVRRGYITQAQAKRVPGSGVNNQVFSPLPPRKPDGKFVFLYIGRLIKDKGILEYVEAASILKKKYPNAEFHLVGGLWSSNKKSLTVTEAELNGWIQNEWVVFHDKQKDVRPFIGNADCVVMPSYREGMNNSLLEAASMAKPLVGTDVTGCRDIIENEVNGLLCNVKDGKDLAMKMESMMLMDPAKREEMGRRGRERMISEFDKKIVINKYLEAINDVIHASGKERVYPLN